MAAHPLPERQQENVRAFLRWALQNIWGTQEAISPTLKMSQEYISQLKNGHKNIGPSVALKIANAAHVPFDALLEGRAIRLLEQPRPVFTEVAHIRSITPTPMPSSKVRYSEPGLDIGPPNRTRAVDMLTKRGYDRDLVESEMSLAALDHGLCTSDDKPVHWWIDAIRGKISALGR